LHRKLHEYTVPVPSKIQFNECSGKITECAVDGNDVIVSSSTKDTQAL